MKAHSELSSTTCLVGRPAQIQKQYAISEHAELGNLVTYASSGFGQAPHVAARRLQSRRRQTYPSAGCWPPPPDVRRGSSSLYSGALLARTPGASQIGPTAPRKPASVLTDRHAVGPNVRSLPGARPRVKLARSDLQALCPAEDKPGSGAGGVGWPHSMCPAQDALGPGQLTRCRRCGL